MNNMQEDVKKWLIGLGHLEAQAVSVTLNKVTYFGVSYINHADLTRRIYIPRVAKPKEYERSSNICYEDQACGQTWYMVGYIGHIKPQFEVYHPFGPNFLLAIWPSEHGPIDEHELYKYKRYPITIEALGDKMECSPPPSEE